VTLKPGTYLTGSLFLKSGVTLDVAEGVTLIGSEQLKDYPMLPTRIAGIEMTWPAALVNVRDQHNVRITGKGTIDGDGPVWWKSYGICARRTSRGLAVGFGLRCAAAATDFDSELFAVELGGGILLKRSGFWTVQILTRTMCMWTISPSATTRAGAGRRRTESISTHRKRCWWSMPTST